MTTGQPGGLHGRLVRGDGGAPRTVEGEKGETHSSQIGSFPTDESEYLHPSEQTSLSVTLVSLPS